LIPSKIIARIIENLEPRFGRSILQLSQEQKVKFKKERLAKKLKREERRHQELGKKTKLTEKTIAKSKNKLSSLLPENEQEEKISLKKIDQNNPNKKRIKDKSIGYIFF